MQNLLSHGVTDSLLETVASVEVIVVGRCLPCGGLGPGISLHITHISHFDSPHKHKFVCIGLLRFDFIERRAGNFETCIRNAAVHLCIYFTTPFFKSHLFFSPM